jgi:DNA topoisomerase-1
LYTNVNMMKKLTNNIIFSILNHFLLKQFGGGHKWTTLFHNGLIFPAPYIPHGIPLKYKDELVKLSPEAEEFAMIYVKYIDTEYIKNKMFNKNFWNDWKKLLDKNTPIQSLEDIDFTEYHDKYLKMKECKTKENKEKEKERKKQLDEKYKIALVDGKEQEVSSYYVEPPGIFLGRGSNPLIGKIKRRLYPEDFIINISKDVAIPEPLEGHEWKKVVHNHDVEWIASWNDPVTGKIKYIWLSSSSDFKANNDYNKFELARKLKKKIKRIIESNTVNLHDKDKKIKQLATALYFIDKLAIRVGNEKGDDESDTVGCTTLRLEHLILEGNTLTLDFLGKDSVPYYNSVEVDDIVRDNVKLFMEGKDKYEQLFDLISSTDINTYLQTFMKDLTAKTIRTFRSSNYFQKEIFKIDKKYCNQVPSIDELLTEYNSANLKIARYLNHQKNITKGHNEQIDRINELIKNQKKKLRNAKAKTKKNPEKIKSIKEKIAKLKEKKSMKEELKNLSLGTSKQNYIDPRITISFMKRYNIPVDKLFTAVLQKKFKWAFVTDENYAF